MWVRSSEELSLQSYPASIKLNEWWERGLTDALLYSLSVRTSRELSLHPHSETKRLCKWCPNLTRKETPGPRDDLNFHAHWETMRWHKSKFIQV